ncbi:cytochrome P450 [Nocardia africana]|uniref:Cytochrome P450 144 n=1 Tax=Nocardia africana TaxID=134964 RepID=A0A378WY54_9NOCA|nr:cytochrome P450 [Nocardia africana]MCC3313285.1 cytochrome P450 [Nocardia africana]SUA45361.1 Cytochrome P450 144 [Nocardia africana]
MTVPDVFSPEALQDPYPLLDRLRVAGDVHFLPDQQLYVVLGFDAIRTVLADPQTYSSNLVAVLSAAGSATVSVVEAGGGVDVLATADPPTHTAQRALVMSRFSPRAVAETSELIDAAVAPAVAGLVAAGGGDWMAAVAHRVPVQVIGELIGLPREDHQRLADWSDAAIDLVSGVASPERAGQAALAVLEFVGYLGERLDQAHPGQDAGILGSVAAAVASGTLTRDQGAMLLVQLVTAGAESTASLLGTAVRMVACDEHLQATLRAEPDRIAALVEEAVRIESPFRGHFRVTTAPTRLAGVQLEQGARLMLMWGASNRDPRIVEQPERVDLDRAQPKLHHSFGRGIHFCLGAHLARKETTQAVRALLDATATVTLRDREPVYVPSLIVRRLAHLHLSVTPA